MRHPLSGSAPGPGTGRRRRHGRDRAASIWAEAVLHRDAAPQPCLSVAEQGSLVCAHPRPVFRGNSSWHVIRIPQQRASAALSVGCSGGGALLMMRELKPRSRRARAWNIALSVGACAAIGALVGAMIFPQYFSDAATTAAAKSASPAAAASSPTLKDDTFTTPQGQATTIDVLGNDGDLSKYTGVTISAINGTAIVVGGSVAVTGGTVVLNANKTLTFTPNPGFSGPVDFSYTISADGEVLADYTFDDVTPGVGVAPPGLTPDAATDDWGVEEGTGVGGTQSFFGGNLPTTPCSGPGTVACSQISTWLSRADTVDLNDGPLRLSADFFNRAALARDTNESYLWIGSSVAGAPLGSPPPGFGSILIGRSTNVTYIRVFDGTDSHDIASIPATTPDDQWYNMEAEFRTDGTNVYASLWSNGTLVLSDVNVGPVSAFSWLTDAYFGIGVDDRADNFGGTQSFPIKETARVTGVVTVPAITITKSSNPASGAAVEPGQTVEYTLTYTNSGTGAGPVDSTDDLSDVLDDAAMVGSITATNGLSAVLASNDMLRVTGALAAGTSATVTYSVQVKAKADRANSDLVNVVIPDPGTGTCAPDECTTNHKVGDLVVTKSVDPASGSAVKADQELNYTVTFTNQGNAPVAVNKQDDLSAVLEGASVTKTPTTDDPALSVSGLSNGRYTVTGTLQPNTSVSVTYTVKVRPDGERDSDTLANFVVDTGGTPPPTCETTNPVCTVNFVSNIVVSKTSNPPTDSAVVVGDQIDYTLTFENLGLGAGKVDSEDDLSDVLDDARLVSGPTSDTPGVTVSLDSDNVLHVSGSLGGGLTAKVTYSVVVQPEDLRKNSTLKNVVVPKEPRCLPDQCTTTNTVKGFSVRKEVNTDAATPGQELTYSITVTNTGGVPYTEDEPASLTDDISAVVDDATLDESTLPPGMTYDAATRKLSWSGALPAGGQPLVLRYTATVNSPMTGNGTLTNVVVPTATVGGHCSTTAACTTTTPVRAFMVSKSASPATVLPGGVVKYTVRVTNMGKVPFTAADPASFTDNLKDVLDDARVVTETLPSDVVLSGTTLSWSGAVPVGQFVDVEYEVKVDAPNEGDHLLTNVVIPPAGSWCDPTATCTTTTPVAQFHVKKSSTTQQVVAGAVVPYEITVTNTGAVDFTAANPASFTDDLSQVTDDAAYNGDAAIDPVGAGTVTVSGDTLSWSGALPVGDSVTISYTMTVNTPATGDQTLTNVVTTTTPGGNCATGAVDPDCEVTIPQQRFAVSKLVSSTTAHPGDVLTYTVQVANLSDRPYVAPDEASFTDDLTRVLDDVTDNALVPGSVTADIGAATLSGNTLSWAGELAAAGNAGDTALITYQVKVSEKPDGRGDSTLINRVAPTAPGGECLTATSCATTTDISSLVISKQASPGPVVPGGAVTYTVKVTNNGLVPFTGQVPATFEDDLSDVVDDAELDLTSLSAQTTYDPATRTLSWADALPAQSSVDVTYTVTVNDPVTGNGILKNIVTPPPAFLCSPAPATCETTTKVRGYTVEKSVSSTTAYPGDVLRYTIVVKSVGSEGYTVPDAPATIVDDLRALVDDAQIVEDSVTGGAQVSGNTVTWEGALAPKGEDGDTVEITYDVKVDAPAQPGADRVLGNVVSPGSAGGSCLSPTSCETSTEVGVFTVSKSVNTTTARPGDTVEYTVRVDNPSTVPYTAAKPASLTDDLSDVVDDARVDTASLPAGVTVDENNILHWSGAVPAQDHVEFTYRVTVNDTVTGDGALRNVVSPPPGYRCATVDGCATTTKLQAYTVQKSSDAQGPVTPGATVTYRVELTGTGQDPYTDADPATFEDDLSDVVDDATLDVANLPTGMSYDEATRKLTWSGALGVNQTLPLEYTVTVKGPVDGKLPGNGSLKNVVVAPEGSGGDCIAPNACSVTDDVKAYTVNKSVDRASVYPGDKVAYTVQVTNVGQVDYTGQGQDVAKFEDDLSEILDDGFVVTPLSPDLVLTGNVLTWSGALPKSGQPGSTVNVTYQLQVSKPTTGDLRLTNAVVPTGDGGGCVNATCPPPVITDVQQYQAVKQADTGEILPGGIVTYTITVTNTGRVDYTAAEPVRFTDDLSDVFSHAKLVPGSVITEPGGAGTAAVTGDVLSWSGALPAPGEVKIQYQVKVDEDATPATQLVNAVVTESPGGNCEPGSTDPDCSEIIPRGSYRVDKAVSSTSAYPGDTLMYTIQVTNTGDVAYTTDKPASFADDLSRVLDDAVDGELVPGSITGGAVLDGMTLRWSGPLAAQGDVAGGDIVQVTYQVKVKPPTTGADAGDGAMVNTVVPNGPGGACPANCSTRTDVGSYAVAKTSSPSGVAHPNDVVAYTIRVANTSQVPFTEDKPASFTDDLTQVMKNAEVLPESLKVEGSATGGANLNGNILSWSGALPVDGEVSVTYQVKLNPKLDPEQPLVNVAVPGPDGLCNPQVECESRIDPQAFAVKKTVSQQSGAAGAVLTYAVTVTNIGAVDYTAEDPASFTDDLSQVLAVAKYNGDATGGATYQAPILSWSGPLEAGKSVTVTYSVTIVQTTAGTAKNIVVTPGDTGGNCPPASEDPDCQVTVQIDATPAAAVLAKTGAQLSGILAGLGLGAAVLGLGVVLWVRRRRTGEA
ncbi:Ig-like domain-containing protein [Leifsonia sp. C5G2]|uniref:DUF7927 domain-containing protein n=1 Tax=Leifsonia sp. C5G2 TaxID=2735269 RepID=UPI001585C3BF|nr:Ig-like domain-containing protein [Leifsonia sp. C5G2]NUU07434.1 DUF11 domain-containing protein [Leifsonia sp. C5G2]